MRNEMKISVKKLDEKAVTPTKAHPTDSGFDLTAIGVSKNLNDDVYLLSTGIAVTPPTGWFFGLFPRSSISKTGYMLANSVGIVDKHYTGELLIALRKVDKTAPDLEFPVKIAQLVLLPLVYPSIEEIAELPTTDRGDKGFGSTGK